MRKLLELVRSDGAKNGIAVLLAAWTAYGYAYPHTLLGQLAGQFAAPLGIMLGIRSGGVTSTQPR